MKKKIGKIIRPEWVVTAKEMLVTRKSKKEYLHFLELLGELIMDNELDSNDNSKAAKLVHSLRIEGKLGADFARYEKKCEVKTFESEGQMPDNEESASGNRNNNNNNNNKNKENNKKTYNISTYSEEEDEKTELGYLIRNYRGDGDNLPLTQYLREHREEEVYRRIKAEFEGNEEHLRELGNFVRSLGLVFGG